MGIWGLYVSVISLDLYSQPLAPNRNILFMCPLSILSSHPTPAIDAASFLDKLGFLFALPLEDKAPS